MNILSLDETALFYKLTPNQTLCNQAMTRGVKCSKERVSVVFCVSFTGEKLSPLIIKKAVMPRSFRGLDLNKIGVKYTNTFKSWMTFLSLSRVLEGPQQINGLTKKSYCWLVMHPQNIMDEELTNIKVKFLPKNTTSVLQSLDQGIIRSFKAHYEKAFINNLISTHQKQ